MSSFNHYNNAPLPSSETFIRLLDLYPAKFDPEYSPETSTPPLECQISSVSIEALPAYKALSYAWETSLKIHPLSVSGQTLYITPSLATALQHLRHPTEHVILWIDQICISQDDHEEKSNQVPLMSQIYSRATQVLIWLGPAADGSDSLMDAWSAVGQAARDWGLESYYTKTRFPVLQNIIFRSNPTDEATIAFHKICETAWATFDLETTRAMAAWYRRPWFSRVWIVQEMCLGAHTDFICGHKQIPVEWVRHARQVYDFAAGYMVDGDTPPEVMESLNSVLRDPTAPLFAARSRRQNFNVRKSPESMGDTLFQILQRLYVGNTMQATDSRDRIYGLLALATDPLSLGIKPDYVGTQVEDVYTVVAAALIKQGELDVLGFAQSWKPDNKGTLPSWVPDWREPISPSFCSLGPSSPLHEPLFAASGRDMLDVGVRIRTHGGILELEGYVVDEIEEVGEPWFEPDATKPFNPAAYLKLLLHIEQLCTKSVAREYVSDQTPTRKAEAIWRIAIGDIEETATRKKWRATDSFFEGFQSCILSCRALQDPSIAVEARDFFQLNPENEDMATRYRSRMHEMRNKRPFLGKIGFVGMGPLGMEPGDVAVVVANARVPYVLRSRGEDSYVLLGEAYCDGVMDGEILTKREKQSFALL
ncbi:heterokaryon incompatibility protein [Amylocarpus encephaloides]|uniref:Heterokaryon incompatibility protein n=1 Tax=Amylocarpus encephaloides TaxID=45428 RepID=A0A9P7YHX4_9HELO|nr:heterokaryon incompatibility protein [Amylocarpus encephaloides]